MYRRRVLRPSGDGTPPVVCGYDDGYDDGNDDGNDDGLTRTHGVLHAAPMENAIFRLAGGRRGAVGFVLLLLLLRGVFLLAALDPEEERVQAVLDPAGAEWSHGPGRPLYDREELYTGTAAEAMRLGLPLPLSAYRFMSYGSGSLVVSLLARPVYALCGPTYLAFKLIPLLASLLGGLCWFLVVRAWRGPRAALAFALLYALAPPVLVRTGLIAKGDHSEAMAIIGATLLLGTYAAFAITRRSRCVWAAAAGVAAGLGVFFTYSTVPVTGAIALVALLRSRMRPRDVWIAAVAGFALGLVPWILTVVGTQGDALRVYNRPLGAIVDPGEIGRRIQTLVATGFFAGYDLPSIGGAAPFGGTPAGFLVRRLAAWIWMAAVVLGWVRLFRDRHAPGTWLVVAGTAAHLAAFLLTAPDASSRYLVPAYPLLLVAATASWWGEPGRGRRKTQFVAPVVIGLGLLSMLTVTISSSFPALRSPLKGYDWPLLGEVLGAKLTPAGVDGSPPRTRSFLWAGVGRRLARTFPPSAWEQEIASCRADGARPGDGNGPDGIGLAIWEGIGMSLAEAGRIDEIPDLARGMREPNYSRFLAGVFRYPETVFLPLLQARGLPGVESFLSRFEERGQRVVKENWARQRAMLLVHGAALGATPPGSRREDAAGVLSRGVAAVPPEVAERALGWALYRGQRLDGTPRFWVSPDKMRSWDGSGSLTSSKALWEGVAGALRTDLVLRSSQRLLVRDSAAPGTESAAAFDVRRFVRGVPPGMAELFPVHAGSSEAALDPSRPPGYQRPSSWWDDQPTGTPPAAAAPSRP